MIAYALLSHFDFLSFQTWNLVYILFFKHRSCDIDSNLSLKCATTAPTHKGAESKIWHTLSGSNYPKKDTIHNHKYTDLYV